MIKRCGTIAVLALAVLSSSAGAQEPPRVDLARTDRALVREPVYQTDTPLYGLLALGADASTRVWLVLDGDTLYVDRDGDGDLTEENESVGLTNHYFLMGTMTDRTGVRYDAIRIRRLGQDLRLQMRTSNLKHYAGYDPADPLKFTPRPEDAPVIHLGGPLTIRPYGPTPSLVRGGSTLVNVKVGTLGLGAGSFLAVNCCAFLDRNVAPVAEISFPPLEGSTDPIRVRAAIADD